MFFGLYAYVCFLGLVLHPLQQRLQRRLRHQVHGVGGQALDLLDQHPLLRRKQTDNDNETDRLVNKQQQFTKVCV